MKTRKLTLIKIKEYFISNELVPRHSYHALKYASNELAKEANEKPFDIFLFMIEDKPLHYTHSYGFHTRRGRAMKKRFEELYYKYLNNEK